MTAKLAAAIFAAVALFAAAPPAGAQDTGARFFIASRERTTPDPEGDVLQAAAAAGQFTHFLAAVEAAGYAETLRGEGPFTLFAPTDAAFQAIGERGFERLLQPANRDALLALLAYHVVPERVTSQDLAGSARMQSASGYELEIEGGDGLRVNGELAVVLDIEASNGVLHGVNAVLAPPVHVAQR